MPVPYGTSYFDQSGNFHLNGGRFIDSNGVDTADNLNALASAGAEGDVVGPASATDGHVALFDGSTGKLLKSSGSALGTAAAQNVGAFAQVANNLSDVTAATAFGNIKQAATDSATGVVELAIASEVNTGTDATRAITPDALAGSLLGERVVQLEVFAPTTNCAAGDGKKYFVVPAPLNGMNLIGVHGRAITAGTTGTMDVQIRNVTDSVDMLSTKLTWDSTEVGTDTAAAAVIDATKDDVATNDLIAIDVDAVQSTPAQGMIITLRFQLP